MIRAVGSITEDQLARVAAAERLDTLEDVLAWARVQHPPCEILDVIVQDEFTHDVIVRGPSPIYLCFDST